MGNTTFYVSDKKNPRFIDFKDKSMINDLHLKLMLNKTCSMFEWKNLPETIPQRVLEYQLQVHGQTTVFEFESNMYACYGNVGGELNYNYLPSLSIVANPYIPNFNSKTMRVYYGKNDVKSANQITKADMDCVVIPNDILYMGLMPLCEYYSSLLTESILTHRLLLINTRAMNIFIAADGDAKDDFEYLMKELENGNTKVIMGKNIMFKNETLPFMAQTSQNAISQVIESTQYIKASWFNELGLQANYNMKRESINSNEAQLSQDAILPFVDTMLDMRKKHCDLINERFGTNWTVDFSSAWKYTRDEIEQAIDAIDQTSDMEMTEEVEVQPAEQGGNNE